MSSSLPILIIKLLKLLICGCPLILTAALDYNRSVSMKKLTKLKVMLYLKMRKVSSKLKLVLLYLSLGGDTLKNKLNLAIKKNQKD